MADVLLSVFEALRAERGPEIDVRVAVLRRLSLRIEFYRGWPRRRRWLRRSFGWLSCRVWPKHTVRMS